jgi:biotin carboxylase
MARNTKYFLVIEYLPRSVVKAVRALRKIDEFTGLEVLLLSEDPGKYANLAADDVTLVRCNFDDPANLETVLAEYRGAIVGVTCRGDKYVQHLRRVLPMLPSSVPVASDQSLAATTNKQLMRAAFERGHPEITPKFLRVHDASDETIISVEKTMSYPVIVKPADLVSSLLIQSCVNPDELQAALKHTFETVGTLYQQEDRRKSPEVLVEEYLEGDFYSIDAYVTEAGKYYFCPPVAYIPAQQIGIDDFFLYKRLLPTNLSDEQIKAANLAASNAMAAVGLQFSSAHIELVLTKDGWKIIELGPRIGRFRATMYRLGYGIDHSLNDVRARLGLEPDIPSKLRRYCAAYSIYPEKEGSLSQIQGLETLETMREITNLKVYAQPGARCRFAKNGGHALAEFIISADTETEFQELTNWIEKNVHADID